MTRDEMAQVLADALRTNREDDWDSPYADVAYPSVAVLDGRFDLYEVADRVLEQLAKESA
ncbi:hypothetical protein GS534_00700 [Rhodococcus hoagii]|nr:hypothetical protein [Prescottella equi]